MSIPLSIGKLIKNYRQERNITQLDLELMIGASSGSLSRIENGFVNPTKETLQKISEVLKLKPLESTALFGLDYPDPTPEDIEKAKEQVKKYFSIPTTFALLIDNHANVIMASEGFYNFLPYPREEIKKLIGLNLFDLEFNPEYGIKKLIQSNEKLFLYEIVLFRQRMENRLNEPWAKELIERMQKFDDFKENWELSEQVTEDYFPPEARKFKIEAEGKELTLVSNFQYLNSDPRFELTDYLPISENDNRRKD